MNSAFEHIHVLSYLFVNLTCCKCNFFADLNYKLKYIFRNARFFLIKSNNHENVALAKAKGVWSSPPQNEIRLNQAFRVGTMYKIIFYFPYVWVCFISMAKLSMKNFFMAIYSNTGYNATGFTIEHNCHGIEN